MVVWAVVAGVISTPATAHGTGSTSGGPGLTLPLVATVSVLASLAGGGVLFIAIKRNHFRRMAALLFFGLGGVSVLLAVNSGLTGASVGFVVGIASMSLFRGNGLTDCGSCADAALGAVTLHRGLEGVVLATVYVADATLGAVGAGVLAVHAAAETVAVGSLYATRRALALGAVALLQVGFGAGVAAGWLLVDAVPATVESGLLAVVGVILLAVGAQETLQYRLLPSATVPE